MRDGRPSLDHSLIAFIQDHLACPACHGTLRLEPAALICERCGHSYSIIDGIPVLVPAPSPSRP